MAHCVVKFIVFTSLGLRAQAGSSNSEKTEEFQNAEKCGAFHTAKSEKAPHTPTINSKTHTKTTPTKEQTRQRFAAPSLMLFINIMAQYIEVRHGEKRHRMNMQIYTGK